MERVLWVALTLAFVVAVTFENHQQLKGANMVVAKKTVSAKQKEVTKTVTKPADVAKPAVVAAEPKVPKLSKEEAAAKKADLAERNKVLSTATQVLVPIWFGTTSVETAFKRKSMSGEAAICLMFVGASGPNGQCPVGVQMNLRPQFDRKEAQLLTMRGFEFLASEKLTKEVRGQSNKDIQLAHVVLTKKGQGIYDCAKRVILMPEVKGHSYMLG